MTDDYFLSYHCYSERIAIVLHLSYARHLFSNSSTPNFLEHVITTDRSLDHMRLACRFSYIYSRSSTNTSAGSSPPAHLGRGGVNQVLWTEQLWNDHPRKLDREIFEDTFPRKLDPSKISRYTVTPQVLNLFNVHFSHCIGINEETTLDLLAATIYSPFWDPPSFTWQSLSATNVVYPMMLVIVTSVVAEMKPSASSSLCQ